MPRFRAPGVGRWFRCCRRGNELSQPHQADSSTGLRRDAVTREQDLQGRGARPRSGTAYDIGPAAPCPRRVSASAFRRHEAAHGDDHQYAAQSAAPGCRRANFGTRCDIAEDLDRDAAGDAGEKDHVWGDLRDPRPAGTPHCGEQDCRDVSRQDRRAGTHRDCGGAPGASVHPGADEFGAGAGAGVRQYQNRGHEQLRPLPLRRTGGVSLMTEEIYNAEHIVKTFGHGKNQVQAVKDVSFGLEKGQVTCIVGESGSGKSTVARMVLGLMPITSGKLIFQGKDVTNLKGRARTEYWREVQAVFQDPFSAFNQFFTVGKLLDRSMIMVGKQVGQERLEESLSYVGMDTSVLSRYPHQLSGGQRQRVMIARALMMQPEMLVADEATSMLDASLRVNVLNVLKDLRDQLGMTVLFITHDIGQACYLADRVLVMEHGVMVEQGRTDEVIFNPQHEYTKRLLADVPKLHEELELHDLQEELQKAGELA